MKITLDIPDAVLRKAKSAVAERGVSLSVYVTEAIEQKLASVAKNDEKLWIKLASGPREASRN